MVKWNVVEGTFKEFKFPEVLVQGKVSYMI